MMVPRVRHDVALKLLTTARRRKQGPRRAVSCAPTGLRHSSGGQAITCKAPKLSPDGHVSMYTGLRHFTAGHVSA
jgi:hypothetical protein